MFTKKTINIFILLLLSAAVHAQTVQIKKETARIRNEYADGFEVVLEGTTDEVEQALNKVMKTMGKTKSVENYMVVNEPVVKGRTYVNPVYGQAKQLGNIVSAWIGINTGDWSKHEAESINKDLEIIVRDMGINFHRDKIQKQIDESTRAAQAVVRQQQRLNNQNRDLNTKIEDNRREKIQLEKAIENNKAELETLIKKLEKNKKDQDSVAVAGEQIRKVVELHKDRQQKVN
jgi:hypothetical protein